MSVNKNKSLSLKSILKLDFSIIYLEREKQTKFLPYYKNHRIPYKIYIFSTWTFISCLSFLKTKTRVAASRKHNRMFQVTRMFYSLLQKTGRAGKNSVFNLKIFIIIFRCHRNIPIETSLSVFDDKARIFFASYALPSNSTENCHEKLSGGCISSF